MLSLQTRRAPPGIALEARELDGGRLRIGRGAESDWTLADPERVLSKCHCQVLAGRDGWQVVDSSRNGTVLNGRTLEAGVPAAIRDGDLLAFGAYEIELRVVEAAPFGSEAGPRDDVAFPHGFEELDQPFSGPADARALFEPVSAGSLFSARSEVAADRSPELRESFRPPRPSAELLPADWDEPVAAPSAPSAPDHAGAGSPPPPTLPAATGEPVPPAPASAPVPAPDGADASAFATLAAGAGLPGAVAVDPAASLRAVGAAFRAMVRELRRSMMTRAAIKSEFRIEQTMIRAAGNNPLKFAADDDDALAALLGDGRRGTMGPERAVVDALRDMRLHEFAVTAAMREAVRELLDELAPARLGATSSEGRGWRPGRDARLWRRFAERHAALSQALADDFDGAFGRAFGRAYEAAIDEARAADTRRERGNAR